MNTKLFLFAGLMATMSLSSCSDYMEERTTSSNTLKIEVADAGLGSNTRAVYSGYTTTFENGDKIGLYVVKNGNIVTNNACYTYNGSSWTTSTTVEYNDGYTYYAYYPYIAAPYSPDFTQSSVDAIFTSYINDASNKFHVQDQSTKANYQASDLMIALGSKSGTNTVSFSLAHKKGLAVFNGEGALSATFSGTNKPYTHSSMRFFLMKPSTSTEFTDDDAGTYSLSASSGKYVTHNIAESFTNYFLNVTAPAAYTYAGGTNTYSVQSYVENTSGSKQKAASWTASFSTDGGSTWSSNAPSWLTAFTASGAGSTTATSYNATVSAQSSTSGSGVTASSVLQSASKVTDYDLSLHTVSGADCSRTTANCYLVHAAGTYKLPLVYGNAIKNGVTNSTAYSPSGTNSSTFLTPFLNHGGTAISDPWLKNNGATPDGAKLIWQDVSGLIASVGISGDYLTFTINSISEGNAVIAATKSGTVVWSWHIWVTPETLSTQTSIAGNSYTYKVTPVNLGWVNSGNISWTGYEARSCTIKITQLGGQEKTFIISQSPSKTVTASKQGVNTYYQWGRKDPDIPAAAYNSTSNHAAYDISGGSVSPTYLQSSVAIGTTIQNPLIHYYSSSTYGPYSTYQYNLWDANNTATGQIKTKTVKTIYDPCPPGFCIPTSDLWYKMSGNSGSSSSTGSWDSTNLGRLWTSNSPNVYFPASGLRNYSHGSLNNVGSYGYYWSASPYSRNDGHGLYLSSSYWYWNYSDRSYGFPVRAVLEE